MDVVNETISRDGEWFAEKPGFKKWENPWTQIGLNDDGIPIYIIKAFEIANKYAPNISLVYNQHGGMEFQRFVARHNGFASTPLTRKRFSPNLPDV